MARAICSSGACPKDNMQDRIGLSLPLNLENNFVWSVIILRH